MPIQVCVSRVIFKTEKTCQFGYALVTSFSKQEYHATMVTYLSINFKTGKNSKKWCGCGCVGVGVGVIVWVWVSWCGCV
jgi:hypothetical protein